MHGSFRGGGTGTDAVTSSEAIADSKAMEAPAATAAAASRPFHATPLAQPTRGPELWTEKLQSGSNLWHNAQREVVLNIEFMSNRTTRVVLYQFRLSVMLALALLIWETKIKFDENSSNDMQESQPFITLNAVISAVCLTVMLGMAARLLLCIWRVNKAGKTWTPRRKRTVLLIGLEVAVQTVNLVFYLAPNAFVLAKPCSWFLTPIFIFSALRWTCWNTMFCLFVIQAHNPMPARFGHSFALFRAAAARFMRRKHHVQQLLASQTASDGDVTERGRSSTHTPLTPTSCDAQLEAGKLPPQQHADSTSQVAGLAAAGQGSAAGSAAGHSDREEGAKDKAAAKTRAAKRMVVDLPFRTHAYKAMLLWVPCQVVISVFLVHELNHGFNNQGPCTSLEDLRCFPQAVNGTADCINWDYDCKVDNVTVVLTSLTSALLIITLGVYFAMLFFAQRQLAKKPYFAYRVGNILLHVQLQTRLVAAFFFALSNLLFWWVGKHSCTSYIETWMGLTPMEIVMTTLVVTNCICILPGDPKQSALELHAWLQDFAWLEADLPRKVAQRPQVPASEPMFCVETALKMMCWSWVVYCDEKSQGLGEEEQQDGEELDLVTELSGQRLPDTVSAAAAAAAAGGASPTTAALGMGPGGAAAQAAAGWGGQRAPPGPQTNGSGCGTCDGGHGERGEGAEGGRPSSANGKRQQQQQQQQEGEEGEEELCLATALALYKLTEYAVLWGPTHDTKCVIGWADDSDTIVCCFRGTVSLKNMLKNVQVWRASHPPVRGSYLLGRQPMVHAGFLDNWHANALNTQVLDTLRQLLSRQPPGGGRPWQLLFTGHSMGGALASLAAYDATTLCAELAAELGLAGGATQLANITMYSFGAPRPGNHAFARDYIATVPASFAVVHCNDTVARNGKFLVLYKHAAHRIVLSPTGDLIVRPSLIEQSARESFGTSLQEHLLTAYGRSFAAIIRGQFQGGKEHNQGRVGCRVLLQCKYVQLVLRATAGVHQESIIRLGRVTGHPPPGVDQHLASGERLVPARQHTSHTLTSHTRRFARMSRRLSLPTNPPPLARMPTRHSLRPVDRQRQQGPLFPPEEPNGDEAV